MPRHPPYALNNLTNTQHNSTKTDPNARRHRIGKDARVHCAVLNQQTATTPAAPPDPDPHQGPAMCDRERSCAEEAPTPTQGTSSTPSGPNSVPTTGHRSDPAFPARPEGPAVLAAPRTGTGRTGQRSTLEHHPDTPSPLDDRAGISFRHGSAPTRNPGRSAAP